MMIYRGVWGEEVHTAGGEGAQKVQAAKLVGQKTFLSKS